MKKKTLGELTNELARDQSIYCAFDIAGEMVKDIEAQVRLCIDNSSETFELANEFCVVMLIASDQMSKNLIRRKFYAWPFLPKPRPNQTVWHYDKRRDKITPLWCLPVSDTVATLSMMTNVDSEYKNMQKWSRYFYTVDFWKKIREEGGLSMLSEEEYLEFMREEGTKFCGDDTSPIPTNPVDAMRFNTDQISHA